MGLGPTRTYHSQKPYRGRELPQAGFIESGHLSENSIEIAFK